MDTATSFPENLRSRRKAMNLSQEELAAAIGVRQSHISGMENGDTAASLPTLIELARVLHCSTDDLLFNADKNILV